MMSMVVSKWIQHIDKEADHSMIGLQDDISQTIVFGYANHCPWKKEDNTVDDL
jgi:hypothetical protein